MEGALDCIFIEVKPIRTVRTFLGQVILDSGFVQRGPNDILDGICRFALSHSATVRLIRVYLLSLVAISTFTDAFGV
jgi:hypothetical protein